jgi:hypothetical protein
MAKKKKNPGHIVPWEGQAKPEQGLVELLDRVITSVGRAIPAKLRIDIDEALSNYKGKV